MARVWSESDGHWRLSFGQVAGRLCLDTHRPGLRELTVSGSAVSAGPTLALEWLQAAEERVALVPPCTDRKRVRVRSMCVDARIPPPERWHAQLHCYWLLNAASRLACDVLISPEERFQRLELLTISQLRAAEVLVSIDPKHPRWMQLPASDRLGIRWHVLPRDRAAAEWTLDAARPPWRQSLLLPPLGYPVVIVRLPGKQLSYVEYAHPEDCQRLIVRVEEGRCEARFGLFGLDLERGVTVRARLRAAFIPSGNDTHTAQELYEKLLEEEPPLSA